MKRRGRIWLLVSSAVVTVGIVVSVGLWPWQSRRDSRGGPKYSIPTAVAGQASIRLDVVAQGFDKPTDIQFVPGHRGLVVILEKTGKALLVGVRRGQVQDAKATQLLCSVSVQSSSELGLLGLAFDPKFRDNGLFYLNYNPKDGKTRTRVAAWHVDPKRVAQGGAREVRVILEVEQPYSNHNAGQLAFGPDGMLYIGMGDGGFRGDPKGHGQNLRTLLGSMLRIDVSNSAQKPYAVPSDNPFVGKAGARPEIWAYGLRNPWRYSFAPDGRLIVADVGQELYEEVDIVSRGDNLGWNDREGAHCYASSKACYSPKFTDPVYEYDRNFGRSITGGYVYTGSQLPFLKGRYVFADFTDGHVWAMKLPQQIAPLSAQAERLGQFAHNISTFGRDESGELYAGDYTTGEVLKLALP